MMNTCIESLHCGLLGTNVMIIVNGPKGDKLIGYIRQIINSVHLGIYAHMYLAIMGI